MPRGLPGASIFQIKCMFFLRCFTEGSRRRFLTIFAVSRGPGWHHFSHQVAFKNKLKKRSKKRGKTKTCLRKGTGSALIFHLLHVNSERLPHRPKTSIAPLARSLRSPWDSHSFPISSVQIPKRSPLIPWKFRTKCS